MLGVQKITVRSDDNLKSLAERFGPSAEAWPALVAANPHKRTTALGTFETLTPGERLILPYGWTQENPSKAETPARPPNPGITLRTDAGAITDAPKVDATTGAMVTVGATAAIGVMILTKGRMLGVSLAVGAAAAFATKLAIDKMAKGA